MFHQIDRYTILHFYITPSKEFHIVLCLVDVYFYPDYVDQQQQQPCLRMIWDQQQIVGTNVARVTRVASVAGAAANLSEAIDLLVEFYNVGCTQGRKVERSKQWRSLVQAVSCCLPVRERAPDIFTHQTIPGTRQLPAPDNQRHRTLYRTQDTVTTATLCNPKSLQGKEAHNWIWRQILCKITNIPKTVRESGSFWTMWESTCGQIGHLGEHKDARALRRP